jgi:hypothetical protein
LNSGSPDQWYKVILVITRDTASTFDMRVEIWPSTSTGTLLNASPSAVFELQDSTNATIQNSPTIFSYINFSGDRVRYFDDYNVTLAGGASVVEEGAPVVLTSSATASGSAADLTGDVTAAGTAPVTARGFASSTSTSPTTAGSTVSGGSGTGAFTGTTPALAAGTYYVRAYATSSIGTTYGSEVQVTLAGSSSGSGSGSGSGSSAAAARELAATGPVASIVVPILGGVAAVGVGVAMLSRRRREEPQL